MVQVMLLLVQDIKLFESKSEKGEVNDFITGFLKGDTRYGRPADILQYDGSSFFFTDDFKGVLYFVSMK
jgi:glucose/arabinose dehydrogenase